MSVSVFVTVFAPFFPAVTLLSHLCVVCRHFSRLMWTFYFIGCSSSDIQYKFVIQHTHTNKNKKKKQKNPKGVGATGLTSPCEAPPLFYPNMTFKSILTFSRIIFEVELFELRYPEPGYNHFILFWFVLFC